MSPPTEKLPRDYRVVLLIAAATLGAYFSVRTWVVAIAEAQDAPQRAALHDMQPKVEALFWACVRRGECEPPKGTK